MEQARLAADQFVQSAPTPARYRLAYSHSEDRGNEVWVTYRKEFTGDTDELPDSVTVAVDKKSGTTRWVMRE